MKAFLIVVIAMILVILIATWVWELRDSYKKPVIRKKSEFEMQKDLYWENMERFGFTAWEIDRAFEDIKNLEELKRVNKEMIQSALKHHL